MERTAGSSGLAQPFGRYLQPTTGAFASKHIVRCPTELIGDEIADHGPAEPGHVGSNYRRAADLLPLEYQWATVRWPSPAYQNPSMPIRQGTVLGGVRGQLMQNHRQRLSGLCGKVDFR